MLDYRQLQALATVLELGSFEKAANRLCITQSAISQRVKQLENALGQLLIVRGHPLQPTQAGEKLLQHYRKVRLLQDEVYESLSEEHSEHYSKVAIGVNVDSLATWLLDALTPLLTSENLLLELRVDDQDQTHHLLRQGKVTGCISSSDTPIQGTQCTPLGNMPYRALVTNVFLQRHCPDGVNQKALQNSPAVEFNEKDELQDRYLEKYFGYRGDYPRHRVPSSRAYVDLIMRGEAWGMVPDLQSGEMLDNGQLQELLPNAPLQVPLYWHAISLSTQISRRLSLAIIDHCREILSPIT